MILTPFGMKIYVHIVGNYNRHTAKDAVIEGKTIGVIKPMWIWVGFQVILCAKIVII
tara:strand:- start:602 stop:772 length:171 start_codon:yes stop_codon:yes gene_type:complete